MDFSDEAIKLAQKLSKETGIKANFIESDIYALPEVLKDEFDIVFTSYGVLAWLPDLDKWGEIITHFLKSGGFFYIAEIHPISYVIDNKSDKELKIVDQYFAKNEPERYEGGSDYASSFTHNLVSYEWRYPLSKVITALSQAGLRIEYLHEFPFCCIRERPDMFQDKDGWWHLKGDKIPLTFSIKASKPPC